MNRTVLLSALPLVALAGFCRADILNVPDDFETIQAGIDASHDGDTVLVQPGKYVENIDFNGHNIVLGSLYLTTGDTTYVTRTTIDGNSSNSVVQFGSGEDENTLLSGFTLKNGKAEIGGGIFIRNSSPHLDHLNIHNCVATYESGGGGIYMDRNAAPLIEHTAVRLNSSGTEFDWEHLGGGISCFEGASPTLENCRIDSNLAGVKGGGFYVDNSTLTLSNVLIRGNRAGHGSGGMHCTRWSNIAMTNVVLSDNKGLGEGGGICCEISRIDMTNVTLSRNVGCRGGAINAWGDFVINMTECQIIGNSTEADGYAPDPLGGAIFTIFGGGVMNFDHVLIADNSAKYGGAYYHGSYEDAGPELNFNCVTVVGNSADEEGGGLYLEAGTSLTLQNSILCDNTPNQIFAPRTFRENILAISYTDLEGGQDGIVDNHNVDIDWGDGNIDEDPQFADPDNGDYHLTEGSPCIDAGDPDSDPDPDGTRADMGAFYYPQEVPFPDIFAEPDSIAFPPTDLDEMAVDTLTIRNLGSDTLKVDSIALIQNINEFGIFSGGDPFNLEPQGSHETIIGFAPDDSGNFTATLRILSNDPDQDTLDVPIIGEGIIRAPKISADADTLDFGSVAVGDSSERTLTIANHGNKVLVVWSASLSNEDSGFEIVSGGTLRSVMPDSSFQIVLHFVPNREGAFADTLTISSDDGDTPRLGIALMGVSPLGLHGGPGGPFEFSLQSVAPNPFNQSSVVSYQLSVGGFATLSLYDISGRLAAKVVNEFQQAGEHRVIIGGPAETPVLPTAIYILKLTAGRNVAAMKVVCVR